MARSVIRAAQSQDVSDSLLPAVTDRARATVQFRPLENRSTHATLISAGSALVISAGRPATSGLLWGVGWVDRVAAEMVVS